MIKETTDYKMFNKHASNREINESNLKKITASIQARNLLHLRPLIVNNKFEIIDGQHRLEAAKLLNVPVFYEMVEDIHDEDIILLNDNMKKWETKDYLEYFLSKGLVEYIKLKEFMEKNNFDLSNALILLNQLGGRTSGGFKVGKYVFPKNLHVIDERIFQINHIIKYLSSKMIDHIKYCNSLMFKKTLVVFLNRPDVDFNTFLRKLELSMQLIRPVYKHMDLMFIFIKIYNFRNHDPIG